MYLLYECKAFSFKYTNNKINLWKSNGINNYTSDSDMDSVSIGTTDLPSLVNNGRMSVKLAGAYFEQNINNVINIYIVYKVKPIFRLSDYTVQNALFGAVKITKNTTDTSKLKILQNINTKDMEYALMKVVHLVKGELTMVETL